MQGFFKVIILIALVGLCGACGEDDRRRGSGSGSGAGASATLSFDDARLSAARFSPDGSRLVLVYNADDEDEVVAVMDVDGRNLEILTGPVSYLTAPTWSPDGAQIFYYGSGIERINADGSDPEVIDNAFAAMGPDISPDGTLLAYGVNGSTIRIASLEPEVATIVTEEYGKPRFSPDGTQIAFANAGALRVMDIDGENGRDIVTEDLSYLSSVAWFPDGQRLAVTTENGVEIIDVTDGSRSVAISGFATMEVDVSADGTRIIYGINGQSSLRLVGGF